MNVDASNLVVGRLASVLAKKALAGEKINVVNAEKAGFTGSRVGLAEKWKTRLNLTAKGNPHMSPKWSRMPDKIVRKAIKGMLPSERASGRKAYANIKVFIGVPEELKNEKLETVESALSEKKHNFVTVEELSTLLGAKW